MEDNELKILEEEVKRERAKKESEEKKRKLEDELFQLKNRKIIEDRKKKREKRKKIFGFIKRGGKKIVKGLQQLEIERSPQQTKKRIKKIQGVNVVNNKGKRKLKKSSRISPLGGDLIDFGDVRLS